MAKNKKHIFVVDKNTQDVSIKATYLTHASNANIKSNKTEIDVTIDGSEYTIKANPENIFEVANEYGLEMIIK
jgi:hypothetical protein